MQFLHNQGQITLCIFTFSCHLPVVTSFSKTEIWCWSRKSHSFFENMYRFQDIWRIGNSRFWREKQDFPFFVSFSFIQSMSRCKEVYSQNHNSITFLSNFAFIYLRYLPFKIYIGKREFSILMGVSHPKPANQEHRMLWGTVLIHNIPHEMTPAATDESDRCSSN